MHGGDTGRPTLPMLIALAYRHQAEQPEDVPQMTQGGEVQGAHISVTCFAAFAGDEEAVVSLSTPDAELESQTKRQMAMFGYTPTDMTTSKVSTGKVFWHYFFKHTKLEIGHRPSIVVPRGVTSIV